MTTVMKSQTNNCANGIANLCCPSTPQITSNGDQQQKKVVKVIDPLNTISNRDMNGRGHHIKSPPPPTNGTSTNVDFMQKMKIVEDESSTHGIKLTDVGLPHISVQTIECSKTEKPQTTIIIYKPKNSNRAPTAKVIMTKVFPRVPLFKKMSSSLCHESCDMSLIFFLHKMSLLPTLN